MATDDSGGVVDEAVSAAVGRNSAASERVGTQLSDAYSKAADANGAAATRLGSEVSGAFGRSADRTRTAMEARRAEFGQATATSGSKLAATFADIERMSVTIQQDVDKSWADANRVGSAMANPELLASWVLTPGTAVAAEAALGVASASLLTHLATTKVVSIVSVTIVSTYELADAALSLAAVGLGAVTDTIGEQFRGAAEVTGAIASGFGDVLVTQVVGGAQVVGSTVAGAAELAVNQVAGNAEVTWAVVQTIGGAAVVTTTLVTAASGLVISLVAAELETEFGSLIAGLVDTFDGGDFNPWLAGLNHRLENWERNYWGSFETFLGALGPGYDALINGLIWTGGLLGWRDGGELQDGSIIGAGERANRYKGNSYDVSAVFGGSVGAADHFPDSNFRIDSIRNTILTMGQVDSLGGEDEAVIRVSRTTSIPPAFTLIIPSTREWVPWDSATPNDVWGNLNIMRGQSKLLDSAHQALKQSIDAYYLEHPTEHRPPEVMVAGFSQGGITAGAFAEAYGKEMNVKAVLTAGAPIGKFNIDPSIAAIAYEADGDPVPRVEGKANPTSVQTITGSNGGTPPAGSHNAVLYAQMAVETPPQNSEAFDSFFDNDSVITDYYARK